MTTGFDFHFAVNKYEWLFLETKLSLFGYSIVKSFCINKWHLDFKLKSYSVLFLVGPFMLKLISLNKMYEHVEKILKENEDKFHSEM